MRIGKARGGRSVLAMRRFPSTMAVSALAVAIALAACVVLPVPVPQAGGPTPASRSNVPQELPGSLVKGQTTRAAVIAQFGEPDGRGSDDQWFTYESQVRRGGVHWVLCVAAGGPGAGVGGCDKVGNWLVVRRMIVRFDAAGTVADVSLQSVDCASANDPDCPSGRGDDLLARDREALARQLAESLGPLQAEYPSAYVVVRAGGSCRHSSEQSTAQGGLEVRSLGLAWSGRNGVQHLLKWDADTVIEGPTRSILFWWVDVRTRDGTCTSLSVRPKDVHFLPDAGVARALHELLLRLRDAAGHGAAGHDPAAPAS